MQSAFLDPELVLLGWYLGGVRVHDGVCYRMCWELPCLIANCSEPLLVPSVELCVAGASLTGGVHGEDEGVVHAQLRGK